MRTFLATVALAVPLIPRLCGTFFFGAPHHGLVGISSAPRGNNPHSGNPIPLPPGPV